MKVPSYYTGGGRAFILASSPKKRRNSTAVFLPIPIRGGGRTVAATGEERWHCVTLALKISLLIGGVRAFRRLTLPDNTAIPFR